MPASEAVPISARTESDVRRPGLSVRCRSPWSLKTERRAPRPAEAVDRGAVFGAKTVGAAVRITCPAARSAAELPTGTLRRAVTDRRRGCRQWRSQCNLRNFSVACLQQSSMERRIMQIMFFKKNADC